MSEFISTCWASTIQVKVENEKEYNNNRMKKKKKSSAMKSTRNSL